MSDIEQTHFVAGKVFVFQVPKLESSEGFKAASWPKTPIWTGRLRVVSKGEKVSILLEHLDKDGLFAACPVQNDKTVEQTVDSSRYFVLRVSDGKGRFAVLGIGFNDRTQAFDFKVAVQDQQNGEKAATALSSAPAIDLSLPKDGKIHINLKGKEKEKEKKKESNKGGDGGLSSGMGALKLAPPPSNTTTHNSSTTATTTTTTTTTDKKRDKKKENKEEGFSNNSNNSNNNGKGNPDDWVTF